MSFPLQANPALQRGSRVRILPTPQAGPSAGKVGTIRATLPKHAYEKHAYERLDIDVLYAVAHDDGSEGGWYAASDLDLIAETP